MEKIQPVIDWFTDRGGKYQGDSSPGIYRDEDGETPYEIEHTGNHEVSYPMVIDELVAVNQYFSWAISLLCAEIIAFAKFLTFGLALFLSAILDISIACW